MIFSENRYPLSGSCSNAVRPSSRLPRRSLRRRDLRAHGSERAGRSASGGAGHRSLAGERHRGPAATAIGDHEHLVLVAGGRAGARLATDAHDPKRAPGGRRRRARRAGRPRRTRVALRPLRAGRSRRTRLALLAGRTGRSGVALRPRGALAAASQAERERDQHRSSFRSHALRPVDGRLRPPARPDDLPGEREHVPSGLPPQGGKGRAFFSTVAAPQQSRRIFVLNDR